MGCDQMNITSKDIREIADIYREHYYGVGCESGAVALGNLFDDFYSGRLDENISEWEIDHLTAQEAILVFAEWLVKNDSMWKANDPTL